MATQLTDLALAETQPNWRTALFPSSREKARHSIATAIYTATGTETTGDTINLLSLPIGSVVIPDACKIITNGVGGTGAITALGDAGSSNRYSATSVAVAAAGVNNVTAQNANVTANPPYQVVAGNEILTATLTLAAALTAGQVIVFRIAYILP